MPISSFIKMDGIQGDSKNAKHKNEIDVLSFSWGIKNVTSPTGGGGVGKPEVSDFKFTKEVSRSSPDLFVSVCKGTHINSAVLTVEGLGVGPKGMDGFYKVTFADVLISSVSLEGQGNDTPMEQVSLNFAKVEIEFKDAKGGSNVEVCDFAIGKDL